MPLTPLTTVFDDQPDPRRDTRNKLQGPGRRPGHRRASCSRGREVEVRGRPCSRHNRHKPMAPGPTPVNGYTQPFKLLFLASRTTSASTEARLRLG
jgi:hypothetical protein